MSSLTSKKRRTKKQATSSSSSSSTKTSAKAKFKNILTPVFCESYSQEGLDHTNEDRLWASTSSLKQQQSPDSNRSRAVLVGKRRRSVGSDTKTDDVGLYCCFDGHGGDECSIYLAQHFGREFSTCFNDSITDEDVEPIPSIDLLSNSLHLAISESEDKFMNGIGVEDDSGACLIAVTVSARSVVCACVGDCRAVVGKNLFSASSNSIKLSNTRVLMRQLSTDQTGWEEEERRRIEKMGGHVVDGRINGILEPSRTIGDADLKRVHPPSGLIAEPVVTAFDPFGEWGDDFETLSLIVATDGLWDVIDR